MLVKLLIRDLGVLAAAAVAWWLAAPLSAGEGPLADVTGVLLGFLVGAGAFVLHEWGHLAGAFASRSAVVLGTSLASPSVFTYDSRRNTRGQFLVMSFAGFAATAFAVWAVYALLPDSLLATRVARGLVVFLVVLGVVLEVPLVVYSLLTRRVPPLDRGKGRASAGREAPREEAAA